MLKSVLCPLITGNVERQNPGHQKGFKMHVTQTFYKPILKSLFEKKKNKTKQKQTKQQEPSQNNSC